MLLPSASVDPSGVNRLRSSAVSSLTMSDVTCACAHFPSVMPTKHYGAAALWIAQET